MTKAIQGRIPSSASILSPAARFVCVRYGNERGSMIPLFREQIRPSGPLTVRR